MRMFIERCAVIFSLACLISCAGTSHQQPQESPETPSVLSSESVGFKYFNALIGRAAKQRKMWPYDPIGVAQEFMKSPGAPYVSIIRDDGAGERADSTTVTVIEDGFLDDSLRGTWTRFRLARTADDTWLIVDVRRAYRCWRGVHKDSYSKEPCP